MFVYIILIKMNVIIALKLVIIVLLGILLKPIDFGFKRLRVKVTNPISFSGTDLSVCN